VRHRAHGAGRADRRPLHRLFGIDVTLWSPPHLLGLLGVAINTLACLLIAREAYPARGWARYLGW